MAIGMARGGSCASSVASAVTAADEVGAEIPLAEAAASAADWLVSATPPIWATVVTVISRSDDR